MRCSIHRPDRAHSNVTSSGPRAPRSARAAPVPSIIPQDFGNSTVPMDAHQQLSDRQFGLLRSGFEESEISIEHRAHVFSIISVGIKIDSAVLMPTLMIEKTCAR